MGPDYAIYRLVQQYFSSLRQEQSMGPDHTIYRLVQQYFSNLRQEQPMGPDHTIYRLVQIVNLDRNSQWDQTILSIG